MLTYSSNILSKACLYVCILYLQVDSVIQTLAACMTDESDLTVLQFLSCCCLIFHLNTGAILLVLYSCGLYSKQSVIHNGSFCFSVGCSVCFWCFYLSCVVSGRVCRCSASPADAFLCFYLCTSSLQEGRESLAA